MQKPYKSIQLFQSPFLERLTHVHPITPLLFWSPIVAILIWRSFAIHQFSLYEVSIFAVAGLMTWTFMEYILHRFLFHFESESKVLQKLHFLIHGIHHSDPLDDTRLVMPPILSVILAIGVYWIARLFLGPMQVEPYFAFLVVGYLGYDYVHYSVHHFKPRTRFGKALKQNHMHHHYIDHNARWGVSSPIWDYVFGTMDSVTVNVDVKNKKTA